MAYKSAFEIIPTTPMPFFAAPIIPFSNAFPLLFFIISEKVPHTCTA